MLFSAHSMFWFKSEDLRGTAVHQFRSFLQMGAAALCRPTQSFSNDALRL